MSGLMGIIGRRSADPPDADEVAARRLEVARGNSEWTEIDPPARLRPRGMGLLVDSETDLVWTRRRGEVWAPATASIEYIDPRDPVTFFVDGGDVVFLEPGTPRLWSEHIARQARR